MKRELIWIIELIVLETSDHRGRFSGNIHQNDLISNVVKTIHFSLKTLENTFSKTVNFIQFGSINNDQIQLLLKDLMEIILVKVYPSMGSMYGSFAYNYVGTAVIGQQLQYVATPLASCMQAQLKVTSNCYYLSSSRLGNNASRVKHTRMIKIFAVSFQLFFLWKVWRQ